MKNVISKMFGIALFVFCVTVANAQVELKEHSAVDGVKVFYSWKAAKKANTPSLELAFVLENTNAYCTQVEFSAKINSNGEQKVKSDEYKRCIKPGKKLKGKKKGFVFLIEDAKIDDVTSGKLTIDVDLEVKKASKCK